MVRFPEAEARLFKEKFVCRKCKTQTRAPTLKVLKGLVKCRRCGKRVFKAKRKR